jgi:hypothetical protein
MPISRLHDELRAAHDYLAEAAKLTAARLPELLVSSWGSAAKRTAVRLVGRKPSRVSDHVVDHSFAEIVNQCATLERLLDALRWAETAGSGLREYHVLLCNPTTSSSAGLDDHDLVLRGPRGECAKFEVSDVASVKDGNGKEEKDLRSLGCLSKDGGDPTAWPEGRVFLVVGPEFATRLRKATRHGLKRGAFHYVEFKAPDSDTSLFEVRPGRTTVDL